MKRVIEILIVLVVASMAVYAAVDDKFADIVSETEQKQKVIQARALLQSVRATVRETHSQLLEISQSGSFNTIDAELKQVLIQAWQVVQDANDGFSDPNIAKLLDWRP